MSLDSLLLITVFHFLAAASPGPDFLLVTQQTLSKGRRAGLLCSAGIALGLLVHITYSAFGLASIIANSLPALLVIKLLGGSYLVYLGIKGIHSAPRESLASVGDDLVGASLVKIVAKGFICNVLNPKAPIYFISLFTIVLSPDMPLHAIFIYGIWIIIIQFIWFSLITIVLSNPVFLTSMNKYSHYINRTMGVVMIAIGIKVLVSKSA